MLSLRRYRPVALLKALLNIALVCPPAVSGTGPPLPVKATAYPIEFVSSNTSWYEALFPALITGVVVPKSNCALVEPGFKMFKPFAPPALKPPANVDVPVTESIPPVEMSVLIVVAAVTTPAVRAIPPTTAAIINASLRTFMFFSSDIRIDESRIDKTTIISPREIPLLHAPQL